MTPSLLLLFVATALGIGMARAWKAVVRTHQQRQREWASLDADGIRRGLALLLRRGYDGAFGIFTHKPTQRFVQFRKYIEDNGDVGLTMGFPRVEWTEPFYFDVDRLLRERGVPFDRVPLEGPVVEVIDADFGTDVEMAADIAVAVFADVFQLPGLGVAMKADDICPKDELVVSREHPRPWAMVRDVLRKKVAGS